MKSPVTFVVPLLVVSGDQVRIATDGHACPPGSTIIGLVDDTELAETYGMAEHRARRSVASNVPASLICVGVLLTLLSRLAENPGNETALPGKVLSAPPGDRPGSVCVRRLRTHGMAFAIVE